MKIKWNQVTWYSKAFAGILFVAVFALGFWFGMQYSGTKQVAGDPASDKSIIAAATFKCDAGKNISAAFYSDSVGLSLSDGRKMDLPRAMSASGARYANEDESFVFWNKGDTAFINEGDKETFKNCLVQAQAE